MRHRILTVTLAVAWMGLFNLVAQAERTTERPAINLDGQWQFATDPEGVGEKQQWYLPNATLPKMPLKDYAPKADGTIIVPGSWNAQGYGTPYGLAYHSFLGTGWYRKSVDVPADWKGHAIFLNIGGVHRGAKVWVNGQLVIDRLGSLSALDLDVTDKVQAGQPAQITIAVDASYERKNNPFRGTVDGLATGTEWGGIWGHVALEARNKSYIDDVWVRTTSIDPPQISVNVQLAGTDVAAAKQAQITIVDQNNHAVANKSVTLSPDAIKDGKFVVDLPVQDGKLWSCQTPNLYHARVTLADGDKSLDTVTQRFGIRELKIDGQYFVLNGNRVFLSGAGDDNIYPVDTGALYASKEKIIHRTKLMKTYGFNAIRTHSSSMSPTFYDVCDELGMLVRAELPFNSGGPLNTALRNPVTKDVTMREFRLAIIRHRNHPSVYSWSMGNELRPGVNEQRLAVNQEFQNMLKKYQPESFFIDGCNTGFFKKNEEGINIHYNPVEQLDRTTLDYSSPVNYSEGHPYEFGGVAFDQSGNKHPKPAIIHESGEFLTFPNLVEQLPRFKDTINPLWMRKMQARLSHVGLLDEVPLWAEVSEKLYMRSHKLEMENIRLQDAHSGYDMWLFQDYWNTSNGLMTPYLYPKKHVPATEFIKFNNARTVLLKKNLKLTYRGGDPLDIKFLVWHYAEGALAGEKFEYTIQCGDKQIASKTVQDVSADQGGVTPLAETQVQLPMVDEPAQVQITAKLTVNGKICDNTWIARVFPKQRKPIQTALPVYTSPELVKTFAFYKPTEIPTSGKLPTKAIYLVNDIDERMIEALENGAHAVLVHPKRPIFIADTTMRWRSGFWSASMPYGSVGHLLYDNPLNRKITSENWFDQSWWYLFEDSRAYSMTRMRAGTTHTIIRCIYGAPSGADSALLFDTRVGDGYLMVSGLNHVNNTDRPEVQWVSDRMVEYASEAVMPEATLPAQWLRDRLEALSKPETK